MSFTEIPILDMSLARNEETKPAFLESLRNALLNVGFLYIKNTGIDQSLFDQTCAEGIAFFDLPESEKLSIEMKNQRSFLGYSRVRDPPLSLISNPLPQTTLTHSTLPARQRNHRPKSRLA